MGEKPFEKNDYYVECVGKIKPPLPQCFFKHNHLDYEL
jgi:hypothetical protein